MAVVF